MTGPHFWGHRYFWIPGGSLKQEFPDFPPHGKRQPWGGATAAELVPQSALGLLGTSLSCKVGLTTPPPAVQSHLLLLMVSALGGHVMVGVRAAQCSGSWLVEAPQQRRPAPLHHPLPHQAGNRETLQESSQRNLGCISPRMAGVGEYFPVRLSPS